jgi:hypothetical protein
MKTKLTLSVDKELVQFARAQARKDGKSVSSTFSEFLLTRKAQIKPQIVLRIRDMVGSLKDYKIDDSKVAIRTHYAQKHSH